MKIDFEEALDRLFIVIYLSWMVHCAMLLGVSPKHIASLMESLLLSTPMLATCVKTHVKLSLTLLVFDINHLKPTTIHSHLKKGTQTSCK